MASLDLNARRAARNEAETTFVDVELGYDEAGAPRIWHFYSDPPARAVSILRQGGLSEAIALMIEPTEFEAFDALAPTVGELNSIVELITGTIVGNSSASTTSSKHNGTR